MKSLLLFVTLLGVVTLSSSSFVGSKAANASKRQKATTQFNQPVRLQGVILKGEWLAEKLAPSSTKATRR